MSASQGLLVHNVFFALHDRSAGARRKLVAACTKYLPGHDGVVYFACGELAEGLAREVNDRDWDVGLHLVFRDQSAHDAYQASADHERFIAENKAGWKGVRVFDSVCTGEVGHDPRTRP